MCVCQGVVGWVGVGGGWYGSFQCQPLYVSRGGGKMSFLTALSVAAHVFIHSVSS